MVIFGIVGGVATLKNDVNECINRVINNEIIEVYK